MCKTVGEKFLTKLCPRTDGQPWRFQYNPLHFVVGGYKYNDKISVLYVSKQNQIIVFLSIFNNELIT